LLFSKEKLQFGDSLGHLVSLFEHARGYPMRESMKVLRGMGPAARSDGLIQMLIHHLGIGQQDQRHCIGRIKARSLQKQTLRARKVANRYIHSSKVYVGQTQVIVNADCLLECLTLPDLIAEVRVRYR
jgi:hypothetical protein